MLKKNRYDNGICFSIYQNEENIPFDKWVESENCNYYFPLLSLVDNGSASLCEEGCKVDFENLYELDDKEKETLELPKYFNEKIILKDVGTLNNADFKYSLEFKIQEGGAPLYPEFFGNVISINGNEYLLSKEQYQLKRLVDEFNALDIGKKDEVFNLKYFSKVKEVALTSGCELSPFLKNQNVLVPETIKIKIENDDDNIKIIPSLENDDRNLTDGEIEKFENAFKDRRRVDKTYPITLNNGEKVRVVFEEKFKENLEILKKTKSKQDIQNIIEKPTEYFDPELFDLSELYSDRVIGYGLYKPKFCPFICAYKSEWFPEELWFAGADVITREGGTSRITIKNKDELNKLDKAIKSAQREKSDFVNYNSTTLGIDDAKYLYETAKTQIEKPSKPQDPNVNGRKVLIIEENIENLDFATKPKDIPVGTYTFYENDNLKENISLKKHQKEGVAWLQHLEKYKGCGCLLADDMGLGKTLQLLYFIDLHSNENKNHKPYLIVAPVSLLENWENEYEKFFKKTMDVRVLTTREVPRKFDKKIVEKIQKLDFVLTNYECIRNSQLNFCAVEFEMIVLDEAQKIKTPGTLITNAIKALKGNFKIAMTGTPVENSLMDLWCIMDFCVPSLLGNAKDFSKKYIISQKNVDADLSKIGEQIQDEMGVHFLCRKKRDVAKDLPQKIEEFKKIEMPNVQKNEYIKALKSDGIMLQVIQRIRAVSEHPYLYNGSLNNEMFSIKNIVDDSARLIATQEILKQIKMKNEKVILFAERKEIQKMLQRYCFETFGITSSIINGDTSTKNSGAKESRQTAVDKFQSKLGFNVIIMSPIAAGVGLNVTGANHVIHYSRHWNPAKENQATDRAYRIGQTKDVYVYYPMAVLSNSSKGSFDEVLNDLLCRKNQLAENIIFPTECEEVRPDDFKVLFE